MFLSLIVVLNNNTDKYVQYWTSLRSCSRAREDFWGVNLPSTVTAFRNVFSYKKTTTTLHAAAD